MLFNHNYTDLLFNGPGPTISDEISFLTNKINNLQIQTDNYYKLNEDIILINNKINNEIKQLNNENNINNNKLINEITLLTTQIKQSEIKNNYYYNKIKILENKTYILNIILSIIIIIYFLIIFIIGTSFMFLIFNYDNKQSSIYYYKNYIYIDNNNPIVKLQLKN